MQVLGTSAKPMRALLIAELCNPNWSSVPLVAWNLCNALSKIADVHLVTHTRNRADIEQYGWVEGRDFTVFDSGALEHVLFDTLEFMGSSIHANKGLSALTAASALVYRRFEKNVWDAFGDRIAKGEFDIVHRVSPVSPAIPSVVSSNCRRAGVPFVLGPINGGLPWPAELPELRSQENDWASRLRPLHKFLPGFRRTRRDAAAIIVGSASAFSELASVYKEKAVYIPENGVDIERFAQNSPLPERRPLRIAFVGRLVPLKCVDVLLRAVAGLARSGKAEVIVVGDGPEMGNLKELAETLQISRKVEFAGWVPQPELPKKLSTCDILAFPSVREFGGAVVLEAMAMGLVPVVVGYGGPAEFVNAKTGLVVALQGRDGLVRGFTDAFERLERDRRAVRCLGRAARQRILLNYTWHDKAKQVLHVYKWVLGRGAKPSFGMPFP